jgi:phage terminase small subunit
MISSHDGLTPMQRRFVEEYAIDLNGAQAAVRAGYSSKTARTIASENLSRMAVRVAIRKVLQGEHGYPYARMAELSAIAFADPMDELNWDPEHGYSVKPNAKLVQVVRRTRTDPKTGYTREFVSFKWDRTKAIKELFRRLVFK